MTPIPTFYQAAAAIIGTCALIGILVIGACNETQKEVASPPEPKATAEDAAAMEAKIEELESEIENSTNLISDMEAFILMERAKIDDNPDYDQSFMEEALADQNEQREIIKQAQKQLEELTGSKE